MPALCVSSSEYSAYTAWHQIACGWISGCTALWNIGVFVQYYTEAWECMQGRPSLNKHSDHVIFSGLLLHVMYYLFMVCCSHHTEPLSHCVLHVAVCPGMMKPRCCQSVTVNCAKQKCRKTWWQFGMWWNTTAWKDFMSREEEIYEQTLSHPPDVR